MRAALYARGPTLSGAVREGEPSRLTFDIGICNNCPLLATVRVCRDGLFMSLAPIYLTDTYARGLKGRRGVRVTDVTDPIAPFLVAWGGRI